MNPSLRHRSLLILASRPVWTQRLLDRIESGQIAPVLLNAALRQQLLRHPRKSIRDRATTIMGTRSVTDRSAVVQRYAREMGQLAGDVNRGRRVFRQSCVACHRIEGEGADVGPNAAAFANRGQSGLLVNILDPNREVDPRYLSYVIVLADGRTLVGLIDSQSEASLTFRDSQGQTFAVTRDDIDELQSTTMSLMPENFDSQIDPQAMADLIAYLMAHGQ